MGRAERRRTERKERIEDRKGKIFLKPGDIAKLKNDVAEAAAKHDTEVLLTCFALVLHDEFGFGKKRIMRALESIDRAFDLVLTDKLDVDSMKNRLKKEIGIVIRK